MYTYEERMKAVQLYIKYNHSLASVIAELGYPSHQALLGWYREYKATGDLKKESKRKPKYSAKQKQTALKHYLDHGKCIGRTARTLGYPSRQRLQNWVDEAFPERKKRCISSNSLVKFPQQLKEQAAIDLQTRTCPAKEIAKKYGVTREVIYEWSNQLFKNGSNRVMPKRDRTEKPAATSGSEQSVSQLLSQKDELLKQVATLESEVYRLQLERDVLELASEVLKKDQGIILKKIPNRGKAVLIDALRPKYRLKELLKVLNMAKSSYCYQKVALQAEDKYAVLRETIKVSFQNNRSCYGYRRMHLEVRKSGFRVSEKVIRRVMREEHLIVPFVKKKKFSSYVGEVTPAVENLVLRNFHAEKPNTKWLTDITEFRIAAGKVYLSPIIDCFDGMVVSWSIGVSPNADLANSMLDEAVSLLKSNERPIIHSDRGGHYRWPGWIERMDAANLTRSMSKKGCSPDNAACEGFFGRLKNEMFYGRSWLGVSIDAFIDELNDYIRWYNETRIKLSLGGMSPLEYRRSLGIVYNGLLATAAR